MSGMDSLDQIVQAVTQQIAEAVREHLQLDALEREVRELRTVIEKFPGSVSGQSVAQIPTSGTCWTCLWFGGKICCRGGSPNHNKHVQAGQTCELYKLTKIPRGEAIKRVGDPGGRRATAVCQICGHLVPTKRTGELYQHDLDGHIYRGRGGDKERPCIAQGETHDQQ